MTAPVLRSAGRMLLGTLVRLLACLILILAFLWNVWPLRLELSGVFAFASLASVFAFYELSIRDVKIEWIAGTTLGIICVFVVADLAWSALKPADPSGPLFAATEQSPPARCLIDLGTADKIAVALGLPIGKPHGKFRISAVHGCPDLQLPKLRGGLVINATFYEPNNDIAFQLVQNVYQPLMDLRMTEYCPDKSRLEILDHLGNEVL